MRSMPTQFWPADWKTPRMRIEAIEGSREAGMSSRRRAGSLPPSSRQRGVRDFAAEEAMWCAVGRDPMNVRCAIEGWEVR